MNPMIEYFIQDFIEKNPIINDVGYKTTIDDFNRLNNKVRKVIPKWYVDLLIKYPIADIKIGIPHDYGQPELKNKPKHEQPLLGIVLNRLDIIEQESIECFPGSELIKDKYVCIARDEDSTQEGIYVNFNTEDPALRLVFHDLGESRKELIANSEVLVDKFSELFTVGKFIEND